MVCNELCFHNVIAHSKPIHNVTVNELVRCPRIHQSQQLSVKHFMNSGHGKAYSTPIYCHQVLGPHKPRQERSGVRQVSA
jgi:hypothetical protein